MKIKKVLPGVNVILKGSTTGVSTDISGNFSFAVPHENAVLVFSFIGYLTQEATVGANHKVNISLLPDTKDLDEVVVVAFGTQKKSDMVGSFTTIKPSELQIPSSNLTAALGRKGNQV